MQNQPVIPSEPRSPFSGVEKAALLLLVVAGFGGVILGARYISRNLTLPFQLTLTPGASLSGTQTDLQQQAMKARDTDGDGLNDYDEQEVYGTSPYLSDSDSDGYDDAQEVNSLNDPNCPMGEICGKEEQASVDLGERAASGLVAPEGSIEEFKALFDQAQQDPAAVIANLTPDQLRDLLKQNGVDEATVAQLSDEDLVRMYQEALDLYKQQTETTVP